MFVTDLGIVANNSPLGKRQMRFFKNWLKKIKISLRMLRSFIENFDRIYGKTKYYSVIHLKEAHNIL